MRKMLQLGRNQHDGKVPDSTYSKGEDENIRVKRLRLSRVMVRHTFSTKSGIPCIRIGLGLRGRGNARGLALGRVMVMVMRRV